MGPVRTLNVRVAALTEAQRPAIGGSRDVCSLTRHEAPAARPLLHDGHRHTELVRIHAHRVLKRADTTLAPHVDMRRGEPAESEEQVDRTDVVPLGQTNLSRADDASLEIRRDVDHVFVSDCLKWWRGWSESVPASA